MTDNAIRWVTAITCSSGLEADFAVQQLESAGIDAVARGNDIVGIFGPGFSGPSARGVDVMVPSNMLEEARELLGAD